MKNMVTAGIITILAITLLSGCIQIQPTEQPTDTEQETQQEQETTETTDTSETPETSEATGEKAVYENSEIGFTFEYPSTWKVEEVKDEDGFTTVILGEFNTEKNYVERDLRVFIEHKDYLANKQAKEQELYMTLHNPCEVQPDTWEEYKVYGECTEVSSTITSYLDATPRGDIGFVKAYDIVTPNADWPKMEIWGDLMDEEDYQRYMESETPIVETPLTEAQKEKTKLYDEIVNSLEFK